MRVWLALAAALGLAACGPSEVPMEAVDAVEEDDRAVDGLQTFEN